MSIEIYSWNAPSRPCLFALSLQHGSVFADFNSDEHGHVYAVRVSFDGYGCCVTANEIGKMELQDSRALLQMVAARRVDVEAAAVLLRKYFSQNLDFIWKDALREHELI